MIAKVEPLTPARALRGPFDYRLPERLGEVGVGSLLLVPFGRRRLLGVVVEVTERSDVPAEKLVEPLAALEHGVPAELVSLALWVADAYCSTPARALALVMPPGTGRGERPQVRERRDLAATITEAGRAALSAGRGSTRVSGARSSEGPVPAGQVDGAADDDGGPAPRLGPRQRVALAVLAAGPRPVAELARASGCGHASLRALAERGLLVLARERVRRRPAPPAPTGARSTARHAPTGAQRDALAAIRAVLDAPGDATAGARRLLLHGVTGSGKTEVYLEAVGAALARGRSAIVLVPEIALTPQTLGRFRDRFGDEVAVLHSRLSPGERLDEWRRLREGEASVCVGARSAVFAPVRNLGLIAIDEEHDGSYKQEGDPRYDARRVAERRAGAAGAVLVAGTATPRPESFARLRRLSLPERVDGRALPPVERVSTLGVDGGAGLHPCTLEALLEVRRRSEKAIVLLNRRGWSGFLTCRTCARVWECPDCDVTLVLHRAAARLECHHCGHAEPVPHACPDCSSVSVARHGAGTERLEDALLELLDPLPVVRLDTDAAAASGAAGERLARFDAAPAGVLLGTQMVAKGHDFPDVTLAVVLDADATLRFPDFRAEERTFALVAQLAGRSGRGPRGGRVIVQALDPDVRALRHAARHDSEGFVRGELERRRLLGYPPFAQLVRVVCSSPEAGAEARAAAAVAERIGDALGSAPRPNGDERTAVLGPAPLFRLKGRVRSQVVVKAASGVAAVASVRRSVEVIAGARESRGVAFAVDVDPH